MIIENKENQATLTFMGRQAKELFNKCEIEMLEKKFYPTEQSLPKEIADNVGQAYLFEIKVNLNRDMMVRSITPDTPNTPDHPHSERKRLNEISRKTLFKTEPEKINSEDKPNRVTFVFIYLPSSFPYHYFFNMSIFLILFYNIYRYYTDTNFTFNYMQRLYSFERVSISLN